MTDETPYEQWTVRELRDELRTRSLSTSGSQAELAARLTEADKPPEDLTVTALRDKLREQDKPVSGTKDELVDRLDETTPDSPQTRVAGSDCVVKSDFHVGRAVNGKVCSYHAMHYRADGTPRSEELIPR